MKALARFILGTWLVGSLAACLLKEPVYTSGFLKVDHRLGGVWITANKEGDPRKAEFAVCAPLDEDRYILNSPAADKGGIYFEARPLKVKNRLLLQLRSLASFGDGLPKANDDIYTLVWIEGDLSGPSINVRALNGNSVKGKSPADVKGLLENSAEDWNKLFGEAVEYRRLKGNS